jgi:hypothetical protein
MLVSLCAILLMAVGDGHYGRNAESYSAVDIAPLARELHVSLECLFCPQPNDYSAVGRTRNKKRWKIPEKYDVSHPAIR